MKFFLNMSNGVFIYSELVYSIAYSRLGAAQASEIQPASHRGAMARLRCDLSGFRWGLVLPMKSLAYIYSKPKSLES